MPIYVYLDHKKAKYFSLSRKFHFSVALHVEEINVQLSVKAKIVLVFQIFKAIKTWTKRFWKGGVLYAGHHGWSVKKILDFKWYKKAGITLETISF